MSYRCDICGTKVPHGQHRLTHVLYKSRSNDVARELACCEGCHMMLDELPLASVKDPYYLRPRTGKTVVEVLVEHVPAYVPPPQADEIGRPAKMVDL